MSAAAAILASMRALSLRTTVASSKPVMRSAFRTRTVTRSISFATAATRTVARPSIAARTAHTVECVKSQKRGMKVHSSIRKRCEHCKVSLYCSAGDSVGATMDEWIDG